MRLEVVCVPGCQICRVFDGIRAGPGSEIELTRRHNFHKSHFRGGDMPCQIQGAFRDFIRPIVAFIQWNRFDNALSEAILVLEPRQVNTTEQEIGLIWFEWLHDYRIAQATFSRRSPHHRLWQFARALRPRGCDWAFGATPVGTRWQLQPAGRRPTTP